MFVRTESAPEHRDWWLIGSVVGLLAIGLQMVYSSSVVVAHNEFGDDTYFVVRHAAWLIIGFILTYITSRIDYHIWQRVSVLLMGLCLVSLVIVLVPTFGSTAYGAQRWLKLGPIQLGQPSELAKIVLVLYMADWLSRKGEQVRHFTYGSLPFAIIVGLVAGLVMLQPDLGTTLVVIVTAVTIFFIAGANLIHLALMTIPAAAIIGVLVVNVGWRADRVAAFLNPEDDPLGKGWHTMQTLIALGSGGIQGLGLGESRQKHYYVPNAHTDTIFAIIGEELGIIGTILVVLLFGILAWRGLLIASRSSDMFGRLLAVGMVGKIVWQAALNIAVITNTVPYTGVPLPLISYGASSLVVTMISIGVLYSVLRFRAQIPERAPAMPVSDDSNEAGARTFVGQAADQVGDAEGVIISAAVPSDNPEFQEARARGLPVVTHAQVLGALSRRMRTIAVAGTHGKSTTTALTAHIATECGLDPVVLGGAYSPNLGGSGRAGRGDVLVVEADEFARRFLELTPTIAIITNIEADHLDFYGSFEAVEAAFADFAHRVAPDGSLLVCADVPMNPAIREDHRMQAYGESDEAIWRTSDYRAEKSGIRFLLQTPDGQRLPVTSQLRGRHNALNATAAIAAACLIGVPAHAAVNAAASFVGTQRRFQTVLCNDGLWIVDDYAHHPTEIRATLAAARESHAGRIWAVFQPHTSHRTHALFDEFSMAFVEADEVLLLPIYHPTGREPETVEVTSAGLAEAMHHPRSRSIDSMENIVRLLRTEARWGDLVLLMGAGDVTELGPRLAQGLGTSR